MKIKIDGAGTAAFPVRRWIPKGWLSLESNNNGAVTETDVTSTSVQFARRCGIGRTLVSSSGAFISPSDPQWFRILELTPIALAPWIVKFMRRYWTNSPARPCPLVPDQKFLPRPWRIIHPAVPCSYTCPLCSIRSIRRFTGRTGICR